MPFQYELSALHVNHSLSPHALKWEAFCGELCQRSDVPVVCRRVDVERASWDGLEAAARRVRHAVFAADNADWILLAHHRDDQAETLLLNLLRGTGLAGAAGMHERTGRILRPMLSLGRREIEAYARSHALEWCEDESNGDVRYSRNFVRHRILSNLNERFPACSRNFALAAGRFAEAGMLLDDLARMDMADAVDFPLEIVQLQRLGEMRARNVVRYLLAKNHVMIPGEARLREALRQMFDAAPDRHPSIRLGDHRLMRRKGYIFLEAEGL